MEPEKLFTQIKHITRNEGTGIDTKILCTEVRFLGINPCSITPYEYEFRQVTLTFKFSLSLSINQRDMRTFLRVV